MKLARALRIGAFLVIGLQLALAPLASAIEITNQLDPVEETTDSSVDGLVEARPKIVDVNLDSAPTLLSEGVDESQEDEPQTSQDQDEPKQPEDGGATQYPGVVITQVQTTGGSGRSGEDLIELRNNSDQDIDITDWRIVYSGATAASQSNVADFRLDEAGLGWRLILPAGAYYLLGTEALTSANPELSVDQKFTTALATVGGKLMIYDQSDNLIGGFAWGSANQAVEGSVFTPAANVMERKLLDDQWHQNTRNNAVDFMAGQLRDSYEIGQGEEVFDACLNLPAIQAEVPDGWYRDDLTGNCNDQLPIPLNECSQLVLTEIGANLKQQFIEIHNPADEAVELGGCRIATDRNDKYYQFEARQLSAGEYLSLSIDDTDLTLIKTTSGKVYLLSEDGQNGVDSIEYANLKAETSWALVDDVWLQTYQPTPGEANVYEQFLPCEIGYLRNPDSGRCVKIPLSTDPAPCDIGQERNPDTGRCRLISPVSSLTPCREDQYRHPETNRCRNLNTASSTLAPCKPGQERNPETNRCRAIAGSESSLKPCEEGWERNPETNRCRKISALGKMTDFPVEPIADVGKSFAAWWALGGITALGAGYGTWEWRRELAAAMRRLGGMMSR